MFKAIRSRLHLFCHNTMTAAVFAQANDHKDALAFLAD